MQTKEKQQQLLDKIFGLIKVLARLETHPDEVAKLYAAFQLVSLRIGKEMLKLRNNGA